VVALCSSRQLNSQSGHNAACPCRNNASVRHETLANNAGRDALGFFVDTPPGPAIFEIRYRGVALGAAGYLTKPIDRERLNRVIGRYRASTRPTRILAADDDQIQRERIRGWLEGPHWVVQEAANGREALARLQQNRPDVILLDLLMPEMDGFAVVAALQKEPRWRDIPAIVITSLDLSAADRERLNSGVQSVLVKETFRPAELVERIRRLWARISRPAAEWK
jgi:adenylate cyclase